MKTDAYTGSNFNGIAPLYDALAFIVFGKKLQQAQIVFLDLIPAGSSVLIVGGGTGWLLRQVLLRGKPKRVVYLETSARMLARASRRMLRKPLVGTIEFRLGNETSLTDVPFDVILTPFVLDVFSEQTLRTQFIPRLKNVLNSGGLWLVTDFVNTKIGWQRALLWTMIRFFRLTTGMQARQLADWQRTLAETGLTRQTQQSAVGGMVSAEVWQLPKMNRKTANSIPSSAPQ